MPSSRQPHDPFTDHNLRPTLQPHGSQHSLRSNASTASSRSRQPRDLFAPSLSRRPTSRATPRVEDEVFADDMDSEELDTVAVQRQQRQIKHGGRAGRHAGSPEGRLGRQRSRKEVDGEEEGFVNRQPDGGFLIAVPGLEEAMVQQLTAPELQEEDKLKEMDDHYAAVGRGYFTSGAAVPTNRANKKHEEDFEEYRMPMMGRLREQVLEQLETERWRHEPVDRYHAGML